MNNTESINTLAIKGINLLGIITIILFPILLTISLTDMKMYYVYGSNSFWLTVIAGSILSIIGCACGLTLWINEMINKPHNTNPLLPYELVGRLFVFIGLVLFIIWISFLLLFQQNIMNITNEEYNIYNVLSKSAGSSIIIGALYFLARKIWINIKNKVD